MAETQFALQNSAGTVVHKMEDDGNATHTTVTATTITQGGATVRGGLPKTIPVSGGSAGDITVTGIAADDVLCSVADITTPSDLTGEFSITGGNTINNTGGTDTTGLTLLVQFVDVSA